MLDYEVVEDEIPYPFEKQSVTVPVPKKHRDWADGLEAVTVELEGEEARILGNFYVVKKILRVPEDCYCIYRLDPEFHVATFDRLTVSKSMTDHYLRDAGLIRAAVYGVSFPAPLAYEVQYGHYVHPRCFMSSKEPLASRGTKYRLKDDDRCHVCDRPFI